MDVAQLPCCRLGHGPSVPEDDDRGAAREDFHRGATAAAPGGLRSPEVVQVAPAWTVDGAERPKARAPVLDLKRGSATAIQPSGWSAVAVDKRPANRPLPQSVRLLQGRPCSVQSFEREPGDFFSCVVERVGIEILRVGHGWFIARATAGGQQAGESGQAGEGSDCMESSCGNDEARLSLSAPSQIEQDLVRLRGKYQRN